jgi:hypothetical protein
MRYKEITEIKKIVAAWHSSHIEVYAAYRGIIDNALKGGDNQLFEDIFSMLQSFVPDDMIRGVEVFFKMVDREISKEGEVKDCQDDPISIMEEFSNDKEVIRAYDNVIMEMQPQIEVVENIIAEKIKMKDNNVFCYYYWMLFDNGPRGLATMYSNYLKRNKVSYFWRWLFKILFKIIVKNSFLYGTKKADWEDYLKTEETMEGQESVCVSLRDVNAVGGKRVDCRGLKELIGNTNIIDVIGIALEKRESDVDIAYMLMNLRLNDLIPDIAYTTFYRAVINEFPSLGIKGVGRGQSEYAELKRLYKMKNDIVCRFSPHKQAMAEYKIEAYNTYFLPFKS